MRTIKFRGKRVKNGEWVYGYYFDCHNGNSFIKETLSRDGVLGNEDFMILDFTVGQFTGLTDLNGKEIYEGDIVHIGPNGQVWSVEYDESEARFIVFNQLNSDRSIDLNFDNPPYSQGNKVVSPVKVQVTEHYSFGLAIIGNIHDNPELLESK